MCQRTSMSRTFSTSSTQREVIQAQGHSGSNQKSTGVLVEAVLGMVLLENSLPAATPEAARLIAGCHASFPGCPASGAHGRIAPVRFAVSVSIP